MQLLPLVTRVYYRLVSFRACCSGYGCLVSRIVCVNLGRMEQNIFTNLYLAVIYWAFQVEAFSLTTDNS